MRDADPARLPLLPGVRTPARRPAGPHERRGDRGDGGRARAEAVSATDIPVRAAVIAAADGTCPRCGAARAETDRYCLDCGLALPEVTGRVPALRRRWIRRFGWYPGDWIWLTLPTLLVAVAGGAAAIAVSNHRADTARVVTAATPGFAVTTPAAQ